MTDKKQTTYERIGRIIELSNQLEARVKKIICTYLDIKDVKKKDFIQDIMLNNMLLNFSNKVKLFRHLNQQEAWPKFPAASYITIFNIRNIVAHNSVRENVSIEVIEGLGAFTRTNHETVTGSGTLETKQLVDLEKDFDESLKIITAHLREVIEIQAIHPDNN